MYPLKNPKIDPFCIYYNLFNQKELKSLFECTSNIESKFAKINRFDKKETSEINRNFRNCKLKTVLLNKNTNWIYEKIIDQINFINYKNYNMVIKFIEALNFLEYSFDENKNDSGFYKRHVDDDGLYSDHNYSMIRKLSFVIQLSSPEDYDGGKLILYNNSEEHESPNDIGTLITFPSSIMHEVTPVTRGIRHSLVGWIVGPNVL